jgi:acid phosphatase (class A)
MVRALLLAVCVAIAPQAAWSEEAAGPPARDPKKCPAPAPVPAYFTTSQVDIVALLPPPPAADSPEQKADIQAVLDAQRRARAEGTTQRAIDDSEITCARFKDVLGPQLKSEAAAKSLSFINGAAGSASAASSTPKMYWKRPRPYMVNSAVQRLADVAPDGDAAHTENPVDPACAAPPPKNAEEAEKQKVAKANSDKVRDYTSYPSGHTTVGTSCAILLAEVFPEKRAELFARARQYGESRVIVGAHFPSDVESGRLAAVIGTSLMMQNATFERDFIAAQAELRAALGYPAKLPDLEPNKDLLKDATTGRGGGRGGRGVGPPGGPPGGPQGAPPNSP